MKKIIIVILIVFIGNSIYGLEIKDKVITVTANSEMLVVPDEIELEITLQEQSGNTYLSKLEKLFWEKLSAQEITQKQLALDNVNVMYYWFYWWNNREATKKSRKIVLKLSSKTNFLKLMKALDNDWVIDVKILGVSNKEIEHYKKDVELKAMKAAKEKATYLLQSIGEEIGGVISVVEIKSENTLNRTSHLEGVKNSYIKSSGRFFENIPEIRLSYTIKSKFEIK